MQPVKLTKEELERYSRQILVWGVKNQEKIKSTKVAIFGLGGLGSFVSILLASTGFGEIYLIDKEKVELSNLNRQILYTAEDVGKEKSKIAKERLSKLNPSIKLHSYNFDLKEREKTEKIVKKVDIVFDCLDNWKSRLILNEICVKNNKILIHGAVESFFGEVFVVIPRKTACLNCFMKKVENDKLIPVVPSVVSTVASLQVTEAIKLILNRFENLNQLIIFNGEAIEIKKIKVKKNPKCKICSKI